MGTDSPGNRLRRSASALCAVAFVIAVACFVCTVAPRRAEMATHASAAIVLATSSDGRASSALREQLQNMGHFDLLAARAIAKLQRETRQLELGRDFKQRESQRGAAHERGTIHEPVSETASGKDLTRYSVGATTHRVRAVGSSGALTRLQGAAARARDLMLAEGSGKAAGVEGAVQERNGGTDSDEDVDGIVEEGQGLDENPNELQGDWHERMWPGGRDSGEPVLTGTLAPGDAYGFAGAEHGFPEDEAGLFSAPAAAGGNASDTNATAGGAEGGTDAGGAGAAGGAEGEDGNVAGSQGGAVEKEVAAANGTHGEPVSQPDTPRLRLCWFRCAEDPLPQGVGGPMQRSAGYWALDRSDGLDKGGILGGEQRAEQAAAESTADVGVRARALARALGRVSDGPDKSDEGWRDLRGARGVGALGAFLEVPRGGGGGGGAAAGGAAAGGREPRAAPSSSSRGSGSGASLGAWLARFAGPQRDPSDAVTPCGWPSRACAGDGGGPRAARSAEFSAARTQARARALAQGPAARAPALEESPAARARALETSLAAPLRFARRNEEDNADEASPLL